MRKTLAMLTGIVLLASMGTTASARMPARIRARAGKAENYGSRLVCGEGSPLCAEANDALGYNGGYTGHDEPSLLFYSGTPGSGNDSNYRLVVPTDPPILPTQDGTGGTFNFQDRIAFWFGMDLCDNQSAPEYTHDPCVPNSDSNIFDGADPTQARLHRLPSGDGVPGAAVLPAGMGPVRGGHQLRRHEVVRGHGDLQLQQRPEHRRRQQRRLSEHGRDRAGELRVHHEERRAARSRLLRSA